MFSNCGDYAETIYGEPNLLAQGKFIKSEETLAFSVHGT